MPYNASKVPCPMCGAQKRVGDHIKEHIITHSKDVTLYMSKTAIEYTINNKIPMMCRISNPDKNCKGDYALCLICDKSRYYGGQGSIYNFYVDHRDCECADKWHTVAAIFNNALKDIETGNTLTVQMPPEINKSTMLMNQIKKLLSEIKSKTATLESRIIEYDAIYNDCS